MEHTLTRRSIAIAVTLIALATLAGAAVMSRSTAQTGTNAAVTEDNAERAEERLEIRGDIRARAGAQRIVDRTGQAVNTPVEYGITTDWAGEQRFGNGNDWEPAIGADPNSGYVYVLTTRFGNLLCNNCARPSIVMRVSDDGGHTWGPESYLCKGCNAWQYDPQVEVDQNGTVHVTWLAAGWGTWYSQSNDMGQTWSDPVDVKIPLGWSDHGFLTISPDGQDIYVAFNKADSYVVASHDGGTTWGDPVQTNPNGENRYYFHYDGTAFNSDQDGPEQLGATSYGDVYIAATAVTRSPYARGLVRYFMLKSTDGGATWEQIPIDVTQEQPECYNYGCRHDHFAGLSSVSADDVGNIVYTYVGARKAGKGQLLFIRTSTDGGTTWTEPRRLSPTWAGQRRVIAAFPAIEGTGEGDFRLVWMDNRNGLYRWNTWYSRSTDGGMTWTEDVRISDATGGAGYKHAGGYEADYGDYLEVTINMYGDTVAAWGEAFSYYGPGGTWMNVEDAV